MYIPSKLKQDSVSVRGEKGDETNAGIKSIQGHSQHHRVRTA